MEQKIYHSNRNVFYACHYHIVWCPKYRRKVLVGDVAVRLETIIREVCQEREARVSALDIIPDHVHLLAQIDPQFGVHRLVRLIKGCPSRFLRQEFPKLRSRLPTLWPNSYFVSTTGSAPRS